MKQRLLSYFNYYAATQVITSYLGRRDRVMQRETEGDDETDADTE